MTDLKSNSSLLLLLNAMAIGIAELVFLLLYQAFCQQELNHGVGVARPGIAAVLAGGTAIVVAFLGLMLLRGQIRSLLRRQQDDELKYRSLVQSSNVLEQTLRERNEFIETILDNMPIGLSVLTFDDRTIRYMNRKAEEIVGWPLKVINDHDQFWQSAIPDPDYRAEVVGNLDRDLEAGDASQRVWEVRLTKRSGDTAVNLWTSIPMIERNLVIITAQDFTEQRRAEEALRQSEMDRVQLQTEFNLAAEVQRKLLPGDPPRIPGLEIAGLCLPARKAGGDFYDWQETAPGTVTITFGDVMGKGMAAAMLMATVRAALRTVTRDNGPSSALKLAKQGLWHDLEGAERFVTLFLAQLDVASGRMTYVDCGHGYVFLRRVDGSVQELLPRGLPLGISAEETYHEGSCVIKEGDAVIVYSDGLLDAGLGLKIDHDLLAARVAGATHARKMVELIAALVDRSASLPDDTTILVMRKGEEAPSA
jgi:PAS domain S-box-containing protein